MTTQIVIEAARAQGFELVGVCAAQEPPHWAEYREWVESGKGASMAYLSRHTEVKKHPSRLLPDCESVVVVGLIYNQPNPTEPGKPRIARYAMGRDYHKVLRPMLRSLARSLSLGTEGVHWRVCVDSAPLMERDFAQLAGIGWVGKNTMVINSAMGSWFVLGELLTTLRLEPSRAAVGGCGTCTRCIDSCPTGAIVFDQSRWQVDARRCISYLTIEHKGEIDSRLESQLAGWTFGCDVCQEVCPFNEQRDSQPLRARMTVTPDFLRAKQWPDLRQLAQLERDEWDRLTAGSPVRRAGYDGIRRNARLNLKQTARSTRESPST